MLRSSILTVMLLVTALALFSCEEADENPVVPRQAGVLAAAPSLTGTWDMFIENKLPEATIWLEIVDNDGDLAGYYSSYECLMPLEGVCNADNDVKIFYRQTDPEIGRVFMGTLDGYAHADKTVISGNVTISTLEGEQLYTGTFFACKRKP